MAVRPLAPLACSEPCLEESEQDREKCRESDRAKGKKTPPPPYCEYHNTHRASLANDAFTNSDF